MKNTNNNTDITKQHSTPASLREYKDNVFCLLYRDKANLLNLYNSLNDTEYTNTDDLTVTTLKGCVYMKYKNDASFVFGQDLYMFEQQSSRNPNMPLRFLHYLSDVYRQMYNNSDLHRRTMLKIPVPHFITFYNGKEQLKPESTLRLSDMYEKCIDMPELELIVRVININTSTNISNVNCTNHSDFIDKCKTLKDYMTFVNKVRTKTDINKSDIRTAVTEAVDECISENVLSNFFKNHREEVIAVSIYEYDEEGHLQVVREEGRQLGKSEERSNGIKVFIKLCKDMNLSDDDTINKLIEDYKLSKEEAITALNSY